MILFASMLAMTSGLAAACFVKAFGITFLAMPRSKRAQEAQEAPFSMKIAMAFLSVLVVGLGVMAAKIMPFLARIAGGILQADISRMDFAPSIFTIRAFFGKENYLSIPLIAAVFIAIMAIIFFCFYLGRRKRVRVFNTWDCGYYNLGARNEYTATAFSKPLRIAFGFFLLPYRKTEKVRDSFYHVRSFKYAVFTTPVFKRYFYDPLLQLFYKTALRMKKLQPGSINLYILYIFLTIFLLVFFIDKF
jgi:hydrogenase-4 component B